jgi:hypothetical protein
MKKNKLSIKFNNLRNNKKITISGFCSCYGVDIDSSRNIFFLDFKLGIMYKIKNDLLSYDVYIFKKKILKKKNILKNKFFFAIYKFFNKNYFFSKPHDIFIDEFDNIYITEMGLGNGGGKGRVTIFSKNLILKKIIGVDHNYSKGLVDPVMSYVNNENLFISEYGKSKILLHSHSSLKEMNFKCSYLNSKKLLLDRAHAFKKGHDNNFYLADTWNHRIIKISHKFECLGWIGKKKSGHIVSSWSFNEDIIYGNEDGAFYAPVDLAFDEKYFFVSDCFNNRISKFCYSGKFCGNLFVNLKNPYGIRLKNNTFYIADKNNFRILIVNKNKVL